MQKFLITYYRIKWQLNWTCSNDLPDSENNSFYACDIAYANPSCPTGQFITSGSFKYGRWNNNICPGPGVNSSTPVSYGIFNLPPVCLQGVNSCNFGNNASLPQIFSDPLPGVGKHVGNQN